MKTHLISYGISDKGIQRASNEDYILINEDCNLFILADGLGGHNAGEIASSLACHYFNNQFLNHKTTEKDRFIRMIGKMNLFLYEKSMEAVQYEGMGTTFIACHVTGKEAIIGHVGDVRGYLFRDKVLNQVTEDQSLVSDLLKKNLLTEEQARYYPYKNVVNQAVGTSSSIEPGFYRIPLRFQDIILLCSDGLWGMVADAEIQNILSATTELHCMAEKLVVQANERGGVDNISLILAEIIQ